MSVVNILLSHAEDKRTRSARCFQTLVYMLAVRLGDTVDFVARIRGTTVSDGNIDSVQVLPTERRYKGLPIHELDM